MLHRYRHVLLAHTQMNWVGRCWFSRKNSTIPKKGEIFQQCQWHQISIKVLSWTHLCSTSAKRTSTRTGAAETFKLFSNLAIASGSEKDGSFFFLKGFENSKKKVYTFNGTARLTELSVSTCWDSSATKCPGNEPCLPLSDPSLHPQEASSEENNERPKRPISGSCGV